MMRKCPECQGQKQVDVGGYADFGRGLEPYEQLEDCQYCHGEGKIKDQDDEQLSASRG